MAKSSEQQNFERFSAMWQRAATVIGGEVSREQVAAYWRILLTDLPLGVIERALLAHIKDPDRGRFVPRPADIYAQVSGELFGHPGPEEAWNIARQAADEATSIVWTDLIAESWGIALPSVGSGDMIGARMAFIEHYKAAARKALCKPKWTLSLGSDPAGREDAIRIAHEQGKIEDARAKRLLGIISPGTKDARVAFTQAALDAPKATPQKAAAHLEDIRRRLGLRIQGRSKTEYIGEEQRAEMEERRRKELMRQAGIGRQVEQQEESRHVS